MTRWRELAEKRREVQAGLSRQVAQKQPQPLSPNTAANSPAHTPAPKASKLPNNGSGSTFGKFGNLGTGSRHDAEATHDLLALWPRGLSDSPQADQLPDPADLLERVAILEADGVPRHQADTQVLAEAGYSSWEALATAWRYAIGRSIVGLSPHGMGGLSSKHLARLIAVTGEFCGSPQFPAALVQGWSLQDLFSVNPVAPRVRVDGWGLVPSIALSTVPAQVVKVDRYAAEIRCTSGSIQRFYRNLPDGVILWWRLA